MLWQETPAREFFPFGAVPQPLALGTSQTKHLGQHAPAQRKHLVRDVPDFPLRTAATAVLKEIQQRAAVHGHDNVARRGLWQDKTRILIRLGPGPHLLLQAIL